MNTKVSRKLCCVNWHSYQCSRHNITDDLNLYEYHYKNLQFHTVQTSVEKLLCDMFADLRRQLFTSQYSATSNKTSIFCL